MGVVINPDSDLGRELQRWNQFPMHKPDGEILPAGNPYVFRPYPKMLYKAHPDRSGKARCMMAEPDPLYFATQPEYDRAVRDTIQFNARCTRKVHDEADERLAKGQGWTETPNQALAVYEREQQAIGNAAAERAYSDQRMSARARAEAEQADAATHEHVAEVKAPKKRPYRRKVKPAPTPTE